MFANRDTGGGSKDAWELPCFSSPAAAGCVQQNLRNQQHSPRRRHTADTPKSPKLRDGQLSEKKVTLLDMVRRGHARSTLYRSRKNSHFSTWRSRAIQILHANSVSFQTKLSVRYFSLRHRSMLTRCAVVASPRPCTLGAWLTCHVEQSSPAHVQGRCGKVQGAMGRETLADPAKSVAMSQAWRGGDQVLDDLKRDNCVAAQALPRHRIGQRNDMWCVSEASGKCGIEPASPPGSFNFQR